MVWTYQSKGAVCKIRFGQQDNVVNKVACDTSNYQSIGAAFLKGWSDNMKAQAEWRRAHPDYDCRGSSNGTITGGDGLYNYNGTGHATCSPSY
jgi:hypothetical protein